MSQPLEPGLLDPAAVEQPPGTAWCRAWSDRVDAALTALLGEQRGVAVIALGGYARRELCPASDVDLLLVHDGWPRSGLEALVQRLCYPLWDARLIVGHAVRTPAEAVTDAGGRIDAATALLDRRLVAGEAGLADALTGTVARWSRRHGRALVTRLAAADDARHERFGRHPGMLEPDLKNGAGGLRDIHSLRWAAGWLLGEATLDALVAAGYLGASERRLLATAGATVLAARCALHQAAGSTGGQVDVLRLDRQDEVAAAPGLLTDGGDADDLLRHVGLAARAVSYVHQRTWGLLLRDSERGRRRRRPVETRLDGGLTLRDGTVDVDAGDLCDDPSLGMRAVAAAATRGGHLSRRAAARLAAEIARARPLPWDAPTRSALLATLHAGPAGLPALLDADHIGLLAAHLPQWTRIRGRPQRNPLHRFDLDTHGAQAVAALALVREDVQYADLCSGLRDADTLVLATWLHDVGKAWPGDHCEAGAAVAGEMVSHMGFGADVADRVGDLVRHHLLLADVATRRDIDDPQQLAAVAEVVGDVATLDSLHLLTVADARATGPAAWSPWKASLVATLHARVRTLLTGEAAPGPDPLVAAAELGATPAQLAALRRHAPEEYYAVAGAAQVAAHARLMDSGRAAVDVRAGEVDGTTVVSIVAGDRRGLLADCTGVLSAHGLEVLEARALTGPRGTALDWLTVAGVADAGAVVRDLTAAAAGDLAVATLRRRRRPPTPAAVAFGPGRVTLRAPRTLDVEAPDRPGLLYDLCRAVADAGADLAAVRGSAASGRIRDVFELAPPAGEAELAVVAAAFHGILGSTAGSTPA